MASPTQWTWVWVGSWSWWWTGRSGVLQFMGLQSVGHNWVTELNWTELNEYFFIHSLYTPKEKKGKGKGSECVLQNDSKWERKYPAQQNQPSNNHSPDGVAKAQEGYVCCSLGMRGRDEGKNRWVHAFLPSLSPHKFKISHKAVASSSKHGVIFIHLLLNNLVAYWTSVPCTCIKVPMWLEYTFIFPFVVS